ncbi:hypothetical protein EYF80_065973 [Liparis tanakae]|uniref:Uncharacterized protein n=1 Tax=Liparis tanakae TaxID=230148 RepID=A0A4Z2E554_9TELE|nr:hypothetical protein EYF80_065973 [Liparis tanakae]
MYFLEKESVLRLQGVRLPELFSKKQELTPDNGLPPPTCQVVVYIHVFPKWHKHIILLDICPTEGPSLFPSTLPSITAVSNGFIRGKKKK